MAKLKISKKMSKMSKMSQSNQSNISPLTIVLLGLLLYLVYRINKMETQKTTQLNVIHKAKPRKVIVKHEDLEDEEPYRENIYKPPRRTPFNIPTRGPPEDYDMVGFLQSTDDSNKLQQLYGRRTYPNSNNWNYYVKSDQYHQIPIPVTIGGQNCTDERGCKELNDKESINVLGKEHKANVYKLEPYYYNPHVI